MRIKKNPVSCAIARALIQTTPPNISFGIKKLSLSIPALSITEVEARILSDKPQNASTSIRPLVTLSYPPISSEIETLRRVIQSRRLSGLVLVTFASETDKIN